MPTQFIQYPSPTLSTGPIEFILDGVTTPVSEDTINEANSVPLPVKVISSVVSPTTVVQVAYHDCAIVGINDNAGAFVAVGINTNTQAPAPFVFAQNTLTLQITVTEGEALQFRIGANAGAAAANPDKFIVNRGDGPVDLVCSFAATDRLWVRSLTTTAITDGLLTINFMG